MEKIQRFFSSGPGKKLSIDEASQNLKISYDALVDLTFNFRIHYHVDADGQIFYFKNELARWIYENPTLLLRARNKIKKRGQGVFK